MECCSFSFPAVISLIIAPPEEYGFKKDRKPLHRKGRKEREGVYSILNLCVLCVLRGLMDCCSFSFPVGISLIIAPPVKGWGEKSLSAKPAPGSLSRAKRGIGPGGREEREGVYSIYYLCVLCVLRGLRFSNYPPKIIIRSGIPFRTPTEFYPRFGWPPDRSRAAIAPLRARRRRGGLPPTKAPSVKKPAHRI
jgi:hypothetical protein